MGGKREAGRFRLLSDGRGRPAPTQTFAMIRVNTTLHFNGIFADAAIVSPFAFMYGRTREITA